MMTEKKVVFQGELGANSHTACQNVFPDYEIMPMPTFEECFHAIQNGVADLGMIPVENSVAGRVADIHHLMPTAGLNIIGEYFLPIHHQLLGVKGTSLEHVKTVQSHIMALGQCRKVIRDLGLKAIVGADTAGAAHKVADEGDPTQAAIASRLAADIYGLDILKPDVEDEAHNTTRFIILSKYPIKADKDQGPVVTTFLFRVRNVPAALYKALGGFATNGVNMTKLESYQTGGQFFATQFYADIEGHPDEHNVKLALEELQFFSAEFKVIGVYPADDYRHHQSEPESNRALRPSPDK